MTFTSSGSRISSTDGYSIEFLGREGVRYTEGDKTICVFSEYLIPAGIGIYVKSIERWDPPYDKHQIAAEERQRILEPVINFRRAAGRGFQA
jgi:hypothetical protein